MSVWKRREFVGASTTGLAALATGRLGWPKPSQARVSLVTVGAGGRGEAMRKAVELIGAPSLSGQWVALKPNFNSAHTFPGSTHPDTLRFLVRFLKERGASRVTVADRSGMGDSKRVMEEKGVLRDASALGFDALPLQDLPSSDWVHVTHPQLHWARGFYLARVFRQADAIVQTCCLKTHRFGGHFTLSLKNTVGMVAKQIPGVHHDFMREMHGSPNQRRMIGELNLSYAPALVVMDAVDCFTDGGPDTGPMGHPNVVLASTDRVAIDAVGVAILRDEGTTPEVSGGPIFGLEQIARAAELGIGVGRADQIEIVTQDVEGRRYAARLRRVLTAA